MSGDLDAVRAVAWMVVDSRGRRSIYMDEARAEQQAAQLHGVVIDLVPRQPLPTPEPDKEPAP